MYILKMQVRSERTVDPALLRYKKVLLEATSAVARFSRFDARARTFRHRTFFFVEIQLD